MVPLGTTHRQLTAAARWTLGAVLMAGALSWWWPSDRSWGAMAGGLVIVFVLWLAARINRADLSAPASLFHLALAGPAAIWLGHFLRHGLVLWGGAHWGIGGILDISAVYQFALAALAATLAQDLLASARRRDIPVLLCGAAMVLGALSAGFWGKLAPLRSSMNFLAFAGLGLWGSVLYSPAERRPAAGQTARRGLRRSRVLAVGSVALLYAALVILFPVEGALSALALGAALLLSAIILGARKARVGAAACILLLALLPLLLKPLWLIPAPASGDANRRNAGISLAEASLFGRGEEAFADLTAATSGLEFLGAAVGWAGLAWLVLGVLLAAVWALWRARGTGEGAATFFRLWAALLALAAFLAPNGQFVPSVTLALGFTWGLVWSPLRGDRFSILDFRFSIEKSDASNKVGGSFSASAQIESRKSKIENCLSGWVLFVLMAGLMLCLGLAPEEGLIMWSVEAFGFDAKLLHIVCGLLVAMVLAWQMGSRRLWKGLVGIGLAAAAGGLGELAQYLFTSTRSAHLGDVIVTGLGCLVGAVVYLLAFGAKACEYEPSPAGQAPSA